MFKFGIVPLIDPYLNDLTSHIGVEVEVVYYCLIKGLINMVKCTNRCHIPPKVTYKKFFFLRSLSIRKLWSCNERSRQGYYDLKKNLYIWTRSVELIDPRWTPRFTNEVRG